MAEKENPQELDDSELDRAAGGDGDATKPAQCPKCEGWVDVPVNGSVFLRCPHCSVNLLSSSGELKILLQDGGICRPDVNFENWDCP